MGFAATMRLCPSRWSFATLNQNTMSIILRFKTQSMGFAATMRLCPFRWYFATLNQKRLIHRPHIQDRVHGLRCHHEIVSLSWIHCYYKPKTPCSSPSDPRSGPCAWLHVMKLCSSLGSIAFFGAALCPTTSNPRSSAYTWPPPCCWQPHQSSSHHCNSHEQSKTIQMEGGALVKVEGGQVEGGAGSQAGSRPENWASV